MLNRARLEEGWFTLFLVWTLVIVAVAAILDAELIDGLQYLPLIATLGTLTGLTLAKSHFTSRTSHFMALVYGLFLVTFLVGRSLPGDLIWRERVVDLVNRQFIWLGKALSQGSSRDGLIFVLHTSAVFWLLGYTAAWFTFRSVRVWRVVLPSGLVLLSVLYYYYGPKPLSGYLALYALIALIYFARIHLVVQEKGWRREAVRYEIGIRLTFLQASFLASILALGLAWGLPTAEGSTAVNDALGGSGIGGTWRDFQENWQRLFASIRSYGTGTNDAYAESLSLGGPRNPGSTLIMDIQVEERLPYVYWQGVVYDTYDEGSWLIADSNETLHLPDESNLNIAPYALRRTVSQNVLNYVPNAGTLYGAPEPINSSRQMFVSASQNSDSNPVVHTLRSRYILRQGDDYEMLSSYSVADANSLRRSGTNYPEWVVDNYLQIPDSITPETIALAEDLASGYDNAFDKAIAIRDFLRSNIAYNDQISAPPEGVEPVHYILFDKQEAYCIYYASAMTIMLRSQGVPARFVAGYAQGEWNDEAKTYRVRSSNSHTWVEVFFDNYGWIQFEPTASIPTGERPETLGNPGDAFAAEGEDADAGLAEGEIENDPSALDEQERLQQLLEEENLLGSEGEEPGTTIRPWQVILALLVLTLAAVAVVIGNRINQQVESDVVRSYGRLASWAHWLGIMIRPAHTPYERANLLSAAVPEGRQPLRNLTHQYVRSRFSQRHDNDEGFDCQEEWKVLRPLLVRKTIVHQLHQLRFKTSREK